MRRIRLQLADVDLELFVEYCISQRKTLVAGKVCAICEPERY